MNNILECVKVSHKFGNEQVLYNIDLNIYAGQFVGVVGPSGCGKSTLLRAIVGTHMPTSGHIFIHEHNCRKLILKPGRDRGIVYQKYSLMPFLTAKQNVALGPILDQTSTPERIFMPWRYWRLRKKYLQEASDILSEYGLGSALDRYPNAMSGGQQQRVALAQAIIMKPRILLLDEPFGALDEKSRDKLQRMLLKLYQKNIDAKSAGIEPPYTILLVTHEINEAIFVCDRIVGLSKAKQTNTGAVIVYDKPAPVFSADDDKNELEKFSGMRREILQVVFGTESVKPV